MARIALGCIADDFTGATDLANTLVRSGMRVVQVIGVPGTPLDAAADAVVVALKSRTEPAQEAVRCSLEALKWLQAQGAQQIYFKYCSTFDSTAEGNIGPVTEALMDALQGEDGDAFTIATPAFPENQRTVYQGHLFVGGRLLNESGMQNHPLTPMRDPNLVRVLQAQCRRKVGLLGHGAVSAGPAAVADAIATLRAAGVRIAIADAITHQDLVHLGTAVRDLPLVTAASGLAVGLPGNFGIEPSDRASLLPPAGGLRAVVAGSCSPATNRQVRHFIERGLPALRLSPADVEQEGGLIERVLAWAQPRLAQGPVLIYSTADPADVRAVQQRLGAAHAGQLFEDTLAAIARGLVARGVRQLVVAGGETSGACVQALQVGQLRIGRQIDPGVPWCFANAQGAEPGLHLALKSGNFGTDDFFVKAFSCLDARSWP